jgi:hypothetical protein
MCLVLTANLTRLSLAFHGPTMTRGRPRAEYDAGKMPGFATSRTTTWRLFLTGTNVPSTIPIYGQETASSSSPSLTAASIAVMIWLGIAGSSYNVNSLTGSACMHVSAPPSFFEGRPLLQHKGRYVRAEAGKHSTQIPIFSTSSKLTSSLRRS